MELTHFDEQGNAWMVDVGEKADTCREAVAVGSIFMNTECLKMVKAGSVAKGDVLGVARVAGIMGAKRTSELIPLCHLLNLTKLALDFSIHEEAGEIRAMCTARTTGKTGVEMEALTGVTIALLTIYDMCKAVDKMMEIGQIYLAYKSGGKSGAFRNKRYEENSGRRGSCEGYSWEKH
ncbi:MAG: cyclic pyranopterin monophosphate synthase MoaC [Lachnospiraceae bacterium]|nr:cyclic pyranopterin monophosphate synthase MoaC [Lachnospiraceae bacterium]